MERALTLAVFAVVALAAWLESRSTAAACVRAGKPWATLIAFEAAPEPPRLYLALFHPAKRAADLVYIPDSTKMTDGRPLSAAREDSLANDADPAGAAKDEADAARELLRPLLGLDADGGAGRFVYVQAAPSDEPDPALQGAAWTRRLPWRLAFSTKGLRADIGRAERLVAAVELHRLGRAGLRPAWLPEDDGARRAFLGRLATEAPPAKPERLTVEVLNATGRHGIALEATKILRSGGADVMASSNAPSRQDKTVIYDRSGAFENASTVKRMLGCRDAEEVSRPDEKRLVDVTVILADDCF